MKAVYEKIEIEIVFLEERDVMTVSLTDGGFNGKDDESKEDTSGNW